MGSSELKLRLNAIPKRVKEAAGEITVTPPVQKLATVPFEWEEAPGKPRPTEPKSKAVRCLQLQLPPTQAIAIRQPSPTSVLDDSLNSLSNLPLCRSRSLSSTASFSSSLFGSRRCRNNRDTQSSDAKVKIIRISRKSSFFSSSTTSYFLVSCLNFQLLVLNSFKFFVKNNNGCVVVHDGLVIVFYAEQHL